ncbi:PREDICTED: uncharacterized protein LOC109176798 isoform X1 [Ipomoea nil]|uniref:uncharacterized protein LOC109176798 isoform X1 n=1 Tax=Ipomoea nil TaxID=35883 RepID=UPI000901C06B|nr:PREDICTED: uncharacterized protein LOC109176798 isoform X1 [Ipomoea nil]
MGGGNNKKGSNKSKTRRSRNAYSGRALFVEGGILSEWQRFDSTPDREKNLRGGNGNGSRNPAIGSKNAAPNSSSGSGSRSRSESKQTRGNAIAYMYPSDGVQDGLASESSGEVKDVKSVGMHPIVLLGSKESKIVAYIDEGSNKEPQNMEHVYDYSTTCTLGERPDVEHQEMECVYDYSTGFSVDENTHRGLGFYNEAEAMHGIGSSSKADDKEDSDFKSSSSDEDMDADVDVDGEMDDGLAAEKLSPEENQGFLSIGGLRLYTHDISEEEDEEDDDEDDLLEEETSGSSESGESTGSSDSDDSSNSHSEIDDEVAADYLESTGGIDHVVNVDQLVGKIQDAKDDDRLDETLEKLSGIALQEASREYGMKKHQSRKKSQGESQYTPDKYVWSSALDDLMLVKDPRTVSGRKKHAAKFPQSWPLESQKSKNFRRNPGEKKKHRKEMIASKRRERMIRRGVDLQKINAKLEKMVLDGADMLSFEPMHTKDCSQVRRLASVYRLWSGCQGSGKKRFVTVARTHHTCMPSANDRVRIEKLIGANDEDDDFTVNGVPANKPSRGSYTTSTPRDSKSSQIKSLKSLSNSGGNKDSSRKKRNGKTGSYSSQPVSFISSGIMSSEKVELKITESTESSDSCHEKKCVSSSTNYGAFELHTTGFGSKMMVKMGFTGGGLGKDGQGIAEPIQVSQRPKALGLGADVPETSTANETKTPTPKSVGFGEDLPTRSRKSGKKGSQGQKAQYGSPGFGSFENHTKGFGSKMMAKMGFVEGTGLGKDSQGITAPILATRRPKSQGLGAK